MNKINISNIQLYKTINAHSQIVTAFLLLQDKRFASSSSDSTIKYSTRPPFQLILISSDIKVLSSIYLS